MTVIYDIPTALNTNTATHIITSPEFQKPYAMFHEEVLTRTLPISVFRIDHSEEVVTHDLLRYGAEHRAKLIRSQSQAKVDVENAAAAAEEPNTKSASGASATLSSAAASKS